jgi:hypothetical protein
MKRILFFVIVLAGYYADGQTLPTKNTTPTEFRELVADSLGLPVDTFSVPSHYNMRLRPWIAAKGDSIYLWSIAQQKWVLNTGGGGGGGSVSSVFGRTGVITAEIGDYSAFYVPLSRTINGYVLSSNVSLTKSDIGLSNVPNIDATARANHTGTQLASTISDFTTAGRNLFSAGTGISYNATTGVISSTGTTSVAWGSVTGSITDQTDLQSALALKEAVANKATTFGTLNNTLYPTTQAVANYVTGLGYTSLSGTGIVKSSGGTISYLTDNSGNWNTAFGWGNHAAAGYEVATNKSTSTTLGTSNILYPSQLAVKTYVDNAVSGSAPALTQYRIGIGNASNLLSSAPAITGSRALVSDANGVPTHSATTATELGYVSGVTSAIQTQINKNLDSLRKRYLNVRAINDTMFALQKWNGTATIEDTVVISLANGDKGDITVNNGWTNWTIDNGAVTNAKLATGIDAAKIADGSVSNTEFQRLDGITGNVQTQLDGKQPNIQFKDEGTNTGTSGGVTAVNFTGAGVTSSHSSGTLTVNIPGGGGTSSGTFKEIRFKWGVTTNAPASGDSVLQHDTLIGKDIEVYREGELQDSTSQYIFNNTTGTITFRPAEFTGERNTIKVYPSGTRTSVALTAPASFATTNRVALYTNTSKTVVGTDVTKWANADGNTALDYSQSDSGYPQDGGSNGLTFDGIAARKLYMSTIPTTQSAPITIYMRVKVNAFPSALFAPSGSAYGVFFDVANTYFNPAGSGYGVVTSGISSATWHTVAITWDGSTADKVYVDGTLLGTAGGSPSGSALDFAILNAQSAGTYFNGNVLGLAIFSVVHDATTVATQTPLFNTVVQ